jgi:hypothetical protein
MIFLAAMLFAQMAPAAPQPSASPIAPLPTITEGSILRRPPPAAGPFIVPPGATLIVNGGSTNFAGFKIAIERDGAAVYEMASGVARGHVAPATAKWLFARLAADRPLDKLPTGQCMKSVSFGSSTTIAWNGETTPDITCAGDPRVQELNRTVAAIEKQLGVVPQPRNRRYIE